MSRELWSHSQFAEYFKASPRRAFEYRRDTLGDPIPDEHLTAEELDAKKNGEEIIIPSPVSIPGVDDVSDESVTEETPVNTETTTNDPIVNSDTQSEEQGTQENNENTAPVVENTDENTETTTENTANEEEVEYNRDQLKEKLDAANIPYFKGAKADKLAELCVQNNLL